jgi:chloramphenicol 3-O-phosphotransferase
MLNNIFSARFRGNRYRHSPTLEECVISYERMTEQMLVVILNGGGAGSSEATEAHAEWMAARTLRATMDALWPSVPAQGQGIAFRYGDGLASNDGQHGMAY